MDFNSPYCSSAESRVVPDLQQPCGLTRDPGFQRRLHPNEHCPLADLYPTQFHSCPQDQEPRNWMAAQESFHLPTSGFCLGLVSELIGCRLEEVLLFFIHSQLRRKLLGGFDLIQSLLQGSLLTLSSRQDRGNTPQRRHTQRLTGQGVRDAACHREVPSTCPKARERTNCSEGRGGAHADIPQLLGNPDHRTAAPRR